MHLPSYLSPIPAPLPHRSSIWTASGPYPQSIHRAEHIIATHTRAPLPFYLSLSPGSVYARHCLWAPHPNARSWENIKFTEITDSHCRTILPYRPTPHPPEYCLHTCTYIDLCLGCGRSAAGPADRSQETQSVTRNNGTFFFFMFLFLISDSVLQLQLHMQHTYRTCSAHNEKRVSEIRNT